MTDDMDDLTRELWAAATKAAAPPAAAPASADRWANWSRKARQGAEHLRRSMKGLGDRVRGDLRSRS